MYLIDSENVTKANRKIDALSKYLRDVDGYSLVFMTRHERWMVFLLFEGLQ